MPTKCREGSLRPKQHFIGTQHINRDFGAFQQRRTNGQGKGHLIVPQPLACPPCHRIGPQEDSGVIATTAKCRWKVAQHELMNVHRRLRLLCRSEEHTSELQSLMRISYAVFCLKKKTQKIMKIMIEFS